MDAIATLGWSEMQMIFATQFAGEIAAITEEGGDRLLRERVAALDDDQRKLVREAIDAAAMASAG